eukprot:4672325-Amphidinium_carterae.1
MNFSTKPVNSNPSDTQRHILLDNFMRQEPTRPSNPPTDGDNMRAYTREELEQRGCAEQLQQTRTLNTDKLKAKTRIAF